jgi:hypothetical protein
MVPYFRHFTVACDKKENNDGDTAREISGNRGKEIWMVTREIATYM